MKTLSKVFAIFLLNLLFVNAHSQYIVDSCAGNGSWDYSGDNGFAMNAGLGNIHGLYVTANGEIYLTQNWQHVVRKIDKNGIITLVAGTATQGYSGDGDSAVEAQLSIPTDIVVDKAGNIYVAEGGNHTIRKINTEGIITTYAGNGTSGFSGDGGFASNATFNNINKMCIDENDNIYLADAGNHRIRKINSEGIVSTVAGNGVQDYSGDGGLATAASLNGPTSVELDSKGNIYISDYGNFCIRKVDLQGNITTYAGTGSFNWSFEGEGGIATSATIGHIQGIAIDEFDNLYFTDSSRIAKVDTEQILTRFAGTGDLGSAGDGGLALNATFFYCMDICIDSLGKFYFSDVGSGKIRVLYDSEAATIKELKGMVYAGTDIVSHGVVVAYQEDKGHYKSVAMSKITNGAYNFPYLVNGNYILHAIPGDSESRGYLPTYYNQKEKWKEADVIAMGDTSRLVDIYLLENTNKPNGTGEISGTITVSDDNTYESELYQYDWAVTTTSTTGSTKSNTGFAARNQLVYLYDNDNKILDWAITDANGNYTFANVAEGSYSVEIAKAGLEIKTGGIVLSSSSDKVEGINLGLGAEIVEPAGILLNSTNGLSLFPNPANGIITIEFGQKSSVEISILTIEGKTSVSQRINSGDSMDVSNLASGYYLVVAKANNSLLGAERLIIK